jgi:hypothetical protein
MKRLFIALTTLCCLAIFVACDNYETYGEKKEKERDAISEFISDSSIVVISEETFHAHGDVTDTAKNEFVYLNNSGVYMQIVHKGCGSPIRDGERTTLIMRFYERCIMDDTQIGNDASPYQPDYMVVERTGNTFTASFTTDGLMYSTYSSASVPTGLITPLSYINVGRPRSADDHISKVRLIVPHTQGHTVASSYVYPYYYEISLQRTIDL